jgi:hypothetical protein
MVIEWDLELIYEIAKLTHSSPLVNDLDITKLGASPCTKTGEEPMVSNKKQHIICSTCNGLFLHIYC